MCVCMDIFKHAKIAKWRHFNVDSLKTLKANYMLIRLLCVYRMTKYRSFSNNSNGF